MLLPISLWKYALVSLLLKKLPSAYTRNHYSLPSYVCSVFEIIVLDDFSWKSLLNPISSEIKTLASIFLFM